MATNPHPNSSNVYKGPDSMRDFFNPDIQPPLPLVELPDKLNPYRGDNVRIYAKMATALPTQNIKFLPALNMLLDNPPPKNATIIEQSSGSTATSLAMVARVLYGNENTRAELYGGPSQPELGDPRGTVKKAHKLAEEDDNYINPGQYDNDNNWASHIRWTGPQILSQLPETDIFCVAMGSAGCITGTGRYLKSQNPSVRVVGVCFPPKDIVPGPRTLPLVEGCDFPWRDTVDAVEIVGSTEAYRLSMELSREGLICGPSSGLTLVGLYEYLGRAKREGWLHELANPTSGEVSAVFMCCDLPYQYLEKYFEKLGEGDFPEVRNQSLLDVDVNEYDSSWELTPESAAAKLYGGDTHSLPFTPSSDHQTPPPTAKLLDLRAPTDFQAHNLPGSVSVPLANLTAEATSPFDDVETLRRQWQNLNEKYDTPEFTHLLDDLDGSREVVILCYNGETARLATSMLRGRGVEAFSIYGGTAGLVTVT
ncbi:hypothetical protein V501_02481 [Pseudogymnoascus sp. VKM F-4519 (FW-2642)]|nr:hypothetical protein V501_02481 [Pseudogymnoascus sp. VKM F-4519 (FW-2642)]